MPFVIAGKYIMLALLDWLQAMPLDWAPRGSLHLLSPLLNRCSYTSTHKRDDRRSLAAPVTGRWPIAAASPAPVPTCLGHQGIRSGGPFYVFHRDSSGIVGHQIHRDAIVDIKPLRMVSHHLRHHGHLSHKAKSADEIWKLKLAVEFSVLDLPTLQLSQMLL